MQGHRCRGSVVVITDNDVRASANTLWTSAERLVVCAYNLRRATVVAVVTDTGVHASADTLRASAELWWRETVQRLMVPAYS